MKTLPLFDTTFSAYETKNYGLVVSSTNILVVLLISRQASLCIPREDGMDVFTTTQWLDMSQSAIAQVTKLPKSR